MISHLEARLGETLREGRKLLIPFLTGGYPDDDRFLAAARAVADAGADALEIGVPFSDPLADGATIQRTSQRSLERGTTLSGVLDRLHADLGSVHPPVVLMSYLNPIHAIGVEAFCERAARSGVAGVLVTDLPPEEMPELREGLRSRGIDRIVLVAPTTRPERIERLLADASGFVYVVTRTGVTGAGGVFSEHLARQIARIRAHSRLPVVAGFGIRSPEDVDHLEGMVDGVVIGARLLEILEEASDEAAIVRGVSNFLGPIRERLDRG